nr:MAG TPA: hypothetical protein [Caudoviricetes sp.]
MSIFSTSIISFTDFFFSYSIVGTLRVNNNLTYFILFVKYFYNK